MLAGLLIIGHFACYFSAGLLPECIFNYPGQHDALVNVAMLVAPVRELRE